MTSQDTDKEFLRGPQLTMKMETTHEEHAFFKEWSASVPTLYFLDICVVNATKLSESAIEKNARKARCVEHLRDLDKPQHSFSYLCALMEKVSDSRGELSDDALERQVLGDISALRTFFKNARVIEPDDFLISYLRELRRVPPELARPNYIRFLETANSQFALNNPVSRKLRLQKAKEIIELADSLPISRQHPVVVLTLACLYGNLSAKKLMKFKSEPGDFNAENALADIMSISRFARFKLEIEHNGRLGSVNYYRSEFITDDDGLASVLRCFKANAVRLKERGDICETRLDFSVNLEQLLTDLAMKQDNDRHQMEGSMNQEADEYERILNLLTSAH